MTLNEFNAWFEGFCESINGAPTRMQFEKIKAKIAEIDNPASPAKTGVASATITPKAKKADPMVGGLTDTMPKTLPKTYAGWQQFSDTYILNDPPLDSADYNTSFRPKDTRFGD